MLLEHFAGSPFGLAQLPRHLGLYRRVQPHSRQLPEQLAFGFADLGHKFGAPGEPLGDLVLLTADIAQRLFQRAQGLGA